MHSEDTLDLRAIADCSGQMAHELVENNAALTALLAPGTPLAQALEASAEHMSNVVSHQAADAFVHMMRCAPLQHCHPVLCCFACAHQGATAPRWPAPGARAMPRACACAQSTRAPHTLAYLAANVLRGVLLGDLERLPARQRPSLMGTPRTPRTPLPVHDVLAGVTEALSPRWATTAAVSVMPGCAAALTRDPGPQPASATLELSSQATSCLTLDAA